MSQARPLRYDPAADAVYADVAGVAVAVTGGKKDTVAYLREQARSRVTKEQILDHYRRTITRGLPRYTAARPEDMLEWRAADEIERLQRLLAYYAIDPDAAPTPAPELAALPAA